MKVLALAELEIAATEWGIPPWIVLWKCNCYTILAFKVIVHFSLSYCHLEFTKVLDLLLIFCYLCLKCFLVVCCLFVFCWPWWFEEFYFVLACSFYYADIMMTLSFLYGMRTFIIVLNQSRIVLDVTLLGSY